MSILSWCWSWPEYSPQSSLILWSSASAAIPAVSSSSASRSSWLIKMRIITTTKMTITMITIIIIMILMMIIWKPVWVVDRVQPGFEPECKSLELPLPLAPNLVVLILIILIILIIIIILILIIIMTGWRFQPVFVRPKAFLQPPLPSHSSQSLLLVPVRVAGLIFWFWW